MSVVNGHGGYAASRQRQRHKNHRGRELGAAVARDTLATTPRSTPSSLTSSDSELSLMFDTFLCATDETTTDDRRQPPPPTPDTDDDDRRTTTCQGVIRRGLKRGLAEYPGGGKKGEDRMSLSWRKRVSLGGR